MNFVHAQYKNIKLVGGYQFWSDPRQAETEKGIPVVLSQPTFLDLVQLVNKYGVTRLTQENTNLFQSGAMSELTFARNARRLNAINNSLLSKDVVI